MGSADITISTRELFMRSVVSEVVMKIGMFNKLYNMRRVSWKGGTSITRPVHKATMTSLYQPYYANERLNGGRKALLDKPKFLWKYAQMPVEFDVEDYLQNGGGAETQVVDYEKFMVEEAHRATREGLFKDMYAAASADTSDADRNFQSIPDALTHDTLYGTVDRDIATTLNTWWQGASIDDSFNGQLTSITPSIANFRKIRAKTQRYNLSTKTLLAVMGSTVFQAFQSECESRHIYNRDGSMLAKQGFNAMMIDGVEFLEEPYLETDATLKKYFLLMDLADWELRLHPLRSFMFTGMKWQGDVTDGYDAWLGRVMAAGNLVCWKPNGSALLYMA